MPSNEEITAALLVLTKEYDLASKTDLHLITHAMLNAAELIRIAKLEREIAKMNGNPDAAS